MKYIIVLIYAVFASTNSVVAEKPTPFVSPLIRATSDIAPSSDSISTATVPSYTQSSAYFTSVDTAVDFASSASDKVTDSTLDTDLTTTDVATTTNVSDSITSSSSSSSATFSSSTAASSILPTLFTRAQSHSDFNIFPVPHRIESVIEEKLKTLSCDLPQLPANSHLWKGNETHELLLPIKVKKPCQKSSTPNDFQRNPPDSFDCQTTNLSWEGVAEIQSGDILLVSIDDSQLVSPDIINQTNSYNGKALRMYHEPQPAVYQVTRIGYENCDATEGVLLDITPLKVDKKKLVTLYDKDLTEGINLIIVSSKLWNVQCVRLKVTVKSDNCGENEDCSGKGLCYTNVSMEGYECQCCPGYVGPHCEEQDACYPSPCKNHGICVDISQGHDGITFQCLCPYGYTGKTCQEETDPCSSTPCLNGATCTGNITQFQCNCRRGYTGKLCQHNVNECESSPCGHGICIDGENGYKCFCKPGFGGVHCQYEYNECQSSPCANGGTCTDKIGTYSCSCGRGYMGKRCEIKVNLCQPNPCPPHHFCQDHGNKYSCKCPKGYTGPDCLLPSRAACSTNPCVNGGTCWSSANSFYCACRPGFTGKTCEDEFVVETITSRDINSHQEDVELDIPIAIHLNHLHNMYIAVGTLACALLIVGLIVAACHCRVNKTYQRFIIRTYPLLPCRKRRNQEPIGTLNSEWFTGKDKAPSATPSRSLPSLDTTDMYYTLNFSESQSSPLIQ